MRSTIARDAIAMLCNNIAYWSNKNQMTPSRYDPAQWRTTMRYVDALGSSLLALAALVLVAGVIAL